MFHVSTFPKALKSGACPLWLSVNYIPLCFSTFSMTFWTKRTCWQEWRLYLGPIMLFPFILRILLLGNTIIILYPIIKLDWSWGCFWSLWASLTNKKSATKTEIFFGISWGCCQEKIELILLVVQSIFSSFVWGLYCIFCKLHFQWVIFWRNFTYKSVSYF